MKRLIACVLMVSATAGCYAWRPQSLVAPYVIAHEQPSVIRVTRTDSLHVVIANPRLVGDSVVGTHHGRPIAQPLSDVAYVSLRRSSNSIGLVILGGVVTVALLAALAASLGGIGSGGFDLDLGY